MKKTLLLLVLDILFRFAIVLTIVPIFFVTTYLATYGADYLEQQNPDMFEEVWAFNVKARDAITIMLIIHSSLMILIPFWIMILGKEKQIIQWVKRQIK